MYPLSKGPYVSKKGTNIYTKVLYHIIQDVTQLVDRLKWDGVNRILIFKNFELESDSYSKLSLNFFSLKTMGT